MSNAPQWPDTESPSESQQLVAIVKAIQYGTSFRLLFATCNDAGYRDDLIKQLRSLAPDKRIQVIDIQRETTGLLGVLKTHNLDQVDAVVIVGLEGWIDIKSDQPFIANLNTSRDAFPEVFSGALLLFAPQHLMAQIQRGAPDFYSVRSGAYTFAPSAESRPDLLRKLTRGGWQETHSLASAGIQERIARLSRLLHDHEAVPLDERDYLAIARLHSALYASLSANGKFEEALVEAQLARDIFRRMRGDNDRETIGSLGNIGNAYLEAGDYAQAIPLLEDACRQTTELLGPNHPDSLLSENNLALAYGDAGHLHKATELLTTNVAQLQRSMGQQDKLTLIAKTNLASFYVDLEQYEKAESVLDDVVTVSRRTLGDHHPQTLQAMNGLASAFYYQGKLASALYLSTQCYETAKTVLGEAHPFTLSAEGNMARISAEMDRLPEAIEHAMHVYRVNRETHGLAYRDTIWSATILGNVLLKAERYEDAREILSEALASAESVLHEGHPYTTAIKGSLAKAIEGAG